MGWSCWPTITKVSTDDIPAGPRRARTGRLWVGAKPSVYIMAVGGVRAACVAGGAGALGSRHGLGRCVDATRMPCPCVCHLTLSGPVQRETAGDTTKLVLGVPRRLCAEGSTCRRTTASAIAHSFIDDSRDTSHHLCPTTLLPTNVRAAVCADSLVTEVAGGLSTQAA